MHPRCVVSGNFFGNRTLGWIVVFAVAIGFPSIAFASWNARLLKDINTSGNAFPRHFTAVGNTVYFTVNQSELWKTDGTEGGTMKLRDLMPSYMAMSLPASVGFAILNGKVYYIDCAGSGDNGLGTSDGTPGGSVRIKKLESTGYPDMLASNGTLWLLTTKSLASGLASLWKSDGTTSGTIQLKTFYTDKPGYGQILAVYKGKLLFAVRAVPDTAWHLWQSDGTSAGTTFIKDLPSSGYSNRHPSNAHVVNDRLLFFADNASGTMDLWRTDGTSAGTQLIMNTITSSWEDYFDLGSWTEDSGDSRPWTWSVVAGNRLVFGVYNETSSSIWSSDGTSAGTVKLMDVGGSPSIVPATFPFEFTDTGEGIAFFVGSWNKTTHELVPSLWRMNTMLQDPVTIRTLPSCYSSATGLHDNITAVTALNGTLLFGISGSSAGNGIWTSDLTAAGTRRIDDIEPPVTLSLSWYFMKANGHVFCSSRSAEYGQEPWILDYVAPPKAGFSATPRTGGAPLTVAFTNLSTAGGAPILDYEWDFGDGGTSHDANPTHIYDHEGAYSVTLTVSSADDVDATTQMWYIEAGNALSSVSAKGLILLLTAVLIAGVGALRFRRHGQTSNGSRAQ